MKALVTKLRSFVALTDQELEALEGLHGPQVSLPAGGELLYEGQAEHSAYVLHSGWMCSHKHLPNGARQIIDVQIPGDLVGLMAVHLPRSDQTFEALTDVQLSSLRTSHLLSTFGAFPNLALGLLRIVSRDAAMSVERLVSIGRRDATQRTAHFLLELWMRMRWVNQATDQGFQCPLSQSVLADVLGITPIHLNRVLRQLREAQLLMFRDGNVTFPDCKHLAEIAAFDLSYLGGGATH